MTAMVTILVKKDNLKKLHWSATTNEFLKEQIEKKLAQLGESIYCDSLGKPSTLHYRERMEIAIDIGNFAMMIADKADRKLEG
jgi:hypothetical protein